MNPKSTEDFTEPISALYKGGYREKSHNSSPALPMHKRGKSKWEKLAEYTALELKVK